MSKMADALRDMGVHNNWAMLRRFGGPDDFCVDYSAPAAGRAGWGDVQHASVWHPARKHRFIPIDDKWPHSHVRKRFSGPRRVSLPAAMKWAGESSGLDIAPSPFGGYLPKPLIAKAKAEVKAAIMQRGK